MENLNSDEKRRLRYERQKEQQKIKYQTNKEYKEYVNSKSKDRYKKIKEIVELHKTMASIKI